MAYPQGHHGLLLAGAAGPTSYNSAASATSPNLWWRLDETSGTAAADSTSIYPHVGAIDPSGGVTFASTGVSVVAPSGYAGLVRGVDMAASGIDAVTANIAAGTPATFGTASTGAWTIALWVTGSAGSQYLASRANEAAIIYNYVADTVEFFSIGYSGSDPRPGSQISLLSSDTTTPHMIVYRYNNGTYSGRKNKTNVFNISRSFGVPIGNQVLYLGSDSASAVSNSRFYDFLIWNRYVADAELDAMVDAVNVP